MEALLLEDDRDYRESMVEYLESIDFVVDAFENGDIAYEKALENTYDILLLDVKVPGMSGYDITKNLRNNNISIPILLITSLTEIDNLSIGYEMGCNDYIRKPFSLKELKYRIHQAIMAAKYHQTCNCIKLKYGFCFNIGTNALILHGNPVKLTAMELDIVDLLVKNVGSYVDKYEIISTIWEDGDIDQTDLRMHISRIRNKTCKELIESSRGMGYKIDKL